MADFYCSVNHGDDSDMRDVVNAGTSSTAGNKIELRFDQTAVTRLDLIRALRNFERWIMNGGLNGAGANLPVR